MASSPEIHVRRLELEREAPYTPRTVWKQTELGGRKVLFLCGTIGSEFDAWQRRLSVLSATDAWLSQQIGLDLIERTMDALEGELRKEIEEKGQKLMPRRSPGYGKMPLSLSRTIVETLDAMRHIGVSITDTDLLVPSKSVTAICEIRDKTGEKGGRK